MMSFVPESHHRKSIRLNGYDYTQAGAYYVTICVQNRLCLFGSISESVFIPSAAGIMIKAVWKEMPFNYEGLELGAFVVMPNHIHAIINIIDSHVGAGPRACPAGAVHTWGSAPMCETVQTREQGNHGGLPLRSLPDVVHRYKTMTTKRYADGVKNDGWPPFKGKLWQRNYYEHIIRSDDDYRRIEEYINRNPKTWTDDKLWTG